MEVRWNRIVLVFSVFIFLRYQFFRFRESQVRFYRFFGCSSSTTRTTAKIGTATVHALDVHPLATDGWHGWGLPLHVTRFLWHPNHLSWSWVASASDMAYDHCIVRVGPLQRDEWRHHGLSESLWNLNMALAVYSSVFLLSASYWISSQQQARSRMWWPYTRGFWCILTNFVVGEAWFLNR
jgi:hypothetical protein